MMKLNKRHIVLVSFLVICALAVLFGWLVGAGRLGSERADLLSDRTRFENVLKTVRAQRKELPDLKERQSAFVAQTLGGDLEAVDSRIRARLFALGSNAGLTDLNVSLPGSSAKESPAKRLFKRSGTQRQLREETDFVEVAATISGEGTYEQVVRLLGWIQADGWIKRVNQIRLDPTPDGSRIRVNIRLVTIFLPGREPDELPAPGELEPGRLATILNTNPFRKPPPPKPKPEPKPQVVSAPKKPVVPAAARSFPYDQWMVTGVVQGPDGPEAWLRNAATNERRTLQQGGRIGKAILLEARGEDATFELGEQTFDVRIGRSIAAGRDTSR